MRSAFRFSRVEEDGHARNHRQRSDARFASHSSAAIASSRARPGFNWPRCVCRSFRRGANRILAAGMRLRPRLGIAPARGKHSVVHSRCTWIDVWKTSSAAVDLRALLHASRSGRFRARPRIQAGRSGARTKVIRAIPPIANFIVTSVSIFRWNIWGQSRADRENSPA